MPKTDRQDAQETARLDVRVSLPMGLHARPAARLAQEARRFLADVRVRTEAGEADARSMLDLLSLGLSDGVDCTVEAAGPDAAEAAAAVAAFLRR